MNDEEFYGRCARILGAATDTAPFPYAHRTRWNNRSPGRGRFPDHGMIRRFGDVVHVALRNPEPVNRTFADPHQALAFLETLRPPS